MPAGATIFAAAKVASVTGMEAPGAASVGALAPAALCVRAGSVVAALAPAAVAVCLVSGSALGALAAAAVCLPAASVVVALTPARL